MKIAVIGAGIIGVTTAYELAADGHEVTVFERRGAAAEETSFANAGVVSPAYVTPWASPGMPGKVMRQLFNKHAAVKLSWPLSSTDIGWMRQWRRACQPGTYLANRARLQRLALYSRQRLDHLTQELELDFDSAPGFMVLLRSEKEHQLAQPGLQLLREAGLAFRQINTNEARRIEPALNPDLKFHGAIHLPDDGVANCRQFALLLKTEAQKRGVKFEFNTAVAQVERAQEASILIAGESATRQFDQIVLCAGVDSARLLNALGLKIPLTAIYGYSVSAPIGEEMNAPRGALMDERYKVAISRLGMRVRVAGSAEIGGSLESKSQKAIHTLYKVLHDWFPGAAQHNHLGASVQVWKGARPMLPDGPPVIGPSGLPGLWLNLGHGSSGWALSCGSARVLADLVAGKTANIDMEGLGVERLHA
jgi:D-amino-acid dehydrogenase